MSEETAQKALGAIQEKTVTQDNESSEDSEQAMSDDKFSADLDRAIKAGEVLIDKEHKIASVHIDVAGHDPNTSYQDIAGLILAKLHRRLGLTAELERLGYTVESPEADELIK